MKMLVVLFRSGLKGLTAILASVGLLAFSSQAATSVSQFGITWTFSADAQVGQFANGDWWVVGPVTIISISPASVNGMNGSMTNPPVRANSGVQGFDSRMMNNTYDSTKNFALYLPQTLLPGASLLSSISYVANATKDNPQLQTIAILTVLNAPALAGSFRPPYVGSDRTIRWNISQLDYSVLRSLAPVANTPSLATVTGYFSRDCIEINTGWTGRYMHPDLNYPSDAGTVGTYGREIAHTTADGLLSLQLNYTPAQKLPLLIGLVQRGIDIYGAARNGGYWGDGGGHNIGRKMTMLLAGKVLGDANILASAASTTTFSEDQQTFYVSLADINLLHTSTWASQGIVAQNYLLTDLGMPEWGFNHQDQAYLDDKSWGAPYRDVAAPCMVGHVLTAHLMQLEAAWNHPALFDYYERFLTIAAALIGDSPNLVHNFVHNMWSAYRYSNTNPTVSAPSISPLAGNFLGSVDISISSSTPGATIYYTTDGSTPTQSSAQYAGPFTLRTSATIKALATLAGMADSPLAEADLSVGSFSANEGWQSAAMLLQTNSFSLSFDAQASDANINSVAGIAAGVPTAYTDLAVILRFSTDGVIDARNGGIYQADKVVPYIAGANYHFYVVVDLLNHTYSASVTPEFGLPILFANDYAFRTEQATVSQLTDFAFCTLGQGTLALANVAIGPRTQPPRGFRIVSE